MTPPLAAAALLLVLAPAAGGFVDPLDLPAERSPLASRRPLSAVTATGPLVVAVGQRGTVLRSDDGGASFTQASVPVSTDLTSVFFASPERGWVVGHDGVVLATTDGGRSWLRQLDGRQLALPDASLLDVWFADERTGFAVGAFNLILRTDDGGASWTPWLDRTENPKGLHLHAIARVAGDVWIVGEQGLVLRLDPARRRFMAVPVPHGGSFFGVTGDARTVVAYGLGGSAYRSRDRGARWEQVETGVDTALIAGSALPDGRLVLVTQAGEVLASADGGACFRLASGDRPLPTSAASASGPSAIVLVGAGGVRVGALR